MQANDHHPPTMFDFLVQLIKLVTKCLFVSNRIPAGESVRSDVVHVQGVGNSDEIAAFQLDDERFVGARFIDVVPEAEALENIQGVRGITHEVCIPADRCLPRSS